ncbi:hypothetical protein ATN01_00465 [Buchnera aphidicola (Diuraphis noxia)]|uniref:Lipoprotein n=1 Tax=Buchnera aphidicola subsp. Diuraphis noxia TaxID=118101 RepID=A0A1B2H8C9_BUCDN|nr:hypothetical protein [Buchnera aphidicola]ANZ22336.1 hypothetical protein ATN01_00465 [Buchnera aphidicola (Diuraphis noxia)]
MLILKNIKKNKIFFKIIITCQILNLFLMASCSLKNVENNNNILFEKSKKELKKLIIPKGITLPKKNKEYEIPYVDKDLEKKNHDILPPI